MPMLAQRTPAAPARRSLPRFTRLLAVPLLALVVGLGLAAAPVSAPHARAQDATHLATVQAEYHILLSSYWEPLDPVDLLNAAWDGAAAYLGHQGVAFSTPRPPLAGDEQQALGIFSQSWTALLSEVGNQADPELLAFAADNEMSNHLNDDHTGFLSPSDYARVQAELGGDNATQIGLGILSSSRTPHVITEVAPGGPADQAGVKPGDTIVAINGADARQLAGSDYLTALRGTAGTPVKLTLDRPNGGTVNVTVTINAYSFPIFSSQVLPGGIGYMKLRSFVNPWSVLRDGKTFPQELDAALESFEQAGVMSWVLDLRNDAGGSTAANQALVGRFLADGKTAVATDARGDRSESLVDGHPFRVQHPLAVLVNGQSYSSSEITASALHEYGRAVLVGSRTGGGLGTAEIIPLPDGAAVEVNVAPTVSGKDETVIDQVGVPVDVQADLPTAQDLATGVQADPAVVAATQALQGQQTPAEPAPMDGTLPRDQVQSMAAPYEVTVAEVPPAPEIAVEKLLGTYTIDTDDEWVNFEVPAADAFATRSLAQQRGWLGAQFQFFGQTSEGADIQTQVDLYSTADGAAAALASNDAPDIQTAVDPPIQLGDGTVAYRGKWLNTGSVALAWRHGLVLFTVTLVTVPGEETFDPLVTLAQAIEARWQAQPLP